MTRQLPYQFVALLLFGLLKVWYVRASNDDLAFLLRPTDTLIGLITNSPSVPRPDSGYFHPDLNLLIDKSCAGFNFWILCFVVLSFVAFKHLKRHLHLALSLSFALPCAYILTIIANTSRISIAIFLQDKTGAFFSENPTWWHEAQGVFVYLSFLIAIYLIAEFLLTKLTRPDA